MASPVALIHGSQRSQGDLAGPAPVDEGVDPLHSLAHRLIRSILLENAVGSGRSVSAAEVEMVAHLAAMLAILPPPQSKRRREDLFYRRDIARATARAISPADALAANINRVVITIACAEQNRRDLAVWEGRVDRRQAGIGRRAGFKRSLKEASAGVALYLALAADDADNADGGPSR